MDSSRPTVAVTPDLPPMTLLFLYEQLLGVAAGLIGAGTILGAAALICLSIHKLNA